MSRLFPLALAGALLFSCETDVGDVIFRTSDDPFDDVPVAALWEKPNRQRLEWKKDAACDEYLLMRKILKEEDEGSDSDGWKCVYSGAETEYTDECTGEQAAIKCVYRLDKTRGEKLFKGKKTAWGILGGKERDGFEPNDDPDGASFFPGSVYASLHQTSFKYAGADETISPVVRDVDWYYVDVPAKTTYELNLLEQSHDGRTINDDADMLIGHKVSDAGGDLITNNAKSSTITLENHTLETKRMRFCIQYDSPLSETSVAYEIQFANAYQVGGK